MPRPLPGLRAASSPIAVKLLFLKNWEHTRRRVARPSFQGGGERGGIPDQRMVPSIATEVDGVVEMQQIFSDGRFVRGSMGVISRGDNR